MKKILKSLDRVEYQRVHKLGFYFRCEWIETFSKDALQKHHTGFFDHSENNFGSKGGAVLVNKLFKNIYPETFESLLDPKEEKH